MTFLRPLAAAALIATVAASACQAQPGSYSSQSTTSEGVVAAAKFAVQEQSKKSPVTLIKILSAQSQVVAGQNIRMRLEVDSKEGRQEVLAVVWNKLDGTQQLTNWDVKSESKIETKATDEPVDGGYVKVATTDERVVAAAQFAIATHFKGEPAKLLKILSAETQIVAGRNYRMTLEIETKAGNRQVTAVVWAKLDGSRELTRWQIK